MRDINTITELLQADISEENKAILQKALDQNRLRFCQETESFAYILRAPIKLDSGETIDVLEVRELTGNELRKSNFVSVSEQFNPIDYIIESLALINGRPSLKLGDIKARDLTFLSNLMSFFA